MYRNRYGYRREEERECKEIGKCILCEHALTDDAIGNSKLRVAKWTCCGSLICEQCDKAIERQPLSAWPFPEKKLPGDRDYEKFLAGRKVYQHMICHITTIDGRKCNGPLKPLEAKRFLYGGMNIDFLPIGTRVEKRQVEARGRNWRSPTIPAMVSYVLIPKDERLSSAQEHYLTARGYSANYRYGCRHLDMSTDSKTVWQTEPETDQAKWPAIHGSTAAESVLQSA